MFRMPVGTSFSHCEADEAAFVQLLPMVSQPTRDDTCPRLDGENRDQRFKKFMHFFKGVLLAFVSTRPGS
jgi:hypothetical protein